MKIKYLIPILLIVLIFIVIGCSNINQAAPAVTTAAITAATTASTTAPTSPETTAATTATTSQETTAATTAATTASTTAETTATTTAATVSVAPTIKLSISEGPSYSAGGDVCYYRVKAAVTGKPAPTVIFSKDDSSGAFGKDIAQVNLTKAAPSYTLTATAKNSSGKASDSITLNWVAPKTTAEVSETTAAQDQTSGYYEVFSFNEHGIQTSGTFNIINGSKIKIDYACNDGLSVAELYNLNGAFSGLIEDSIGPVKGETIFTSGPGTYYITATTTSADGYLTMVVYDYKG